MTGALSEGLLEQAMIPAMAPMSATPPHTEAMMMMLVVDSPPDLVPLAGTEEGRTWLSGELGDPAEGSGDLASGWGVEVEEGAGGRVPGAALALGAAGAALDEG